jgi:FG-GAP repeat
MYKGLVQMLLGVNSKQPYMWAIAAIIMVIELLALVPPGWAQPQYKQGVFLTSSEPTLLEGFGFAVASDGHAVVVGAPHAAGSRGQTGKAFLLERESGKVIHTFLPSSAIGDDLFGLSVGLTDQFVVIGSPRGRGQTQRPAGRVEVFDRESGKLVRGLLSSNPTAAVFGHAIAMQGPWVAIGDPGASSPTNFEVGEVFVFELATGKLVQTFLAPEPQQGKADGFGHALTFLGSRLAIGAPMGGIDPLDHGKVYVFDIPSGQLVRTLASPNPQTNEYYGWSLVSDTETLLVGALGRGAEAGAAYLFVNTGEFQKRLELPQPHKGDHFGEAVALLEDSYVVAAPGNDTAGVDAGTVFVFDRKTNSLQLTIPNPSKTTGVADLFGLSMNGNGAHLLVGSPYGDLSKMPDAGVVHQFHFSSFLPTP